MLAARQLTQADLKGQVARLFWPVVPHCADGGPGLIGLEVELIPVKAGSHRLRPATLSQVQASLDHDRQLVSDACISFEPGAQIEFSPPPAPSVTALFEQLRDLLARLRECGGRDRIRFISSGVNPWHTCEEIGLQVDRPRYRVMQAQFDDIGPAGRRMMRQTAALQICLDLSPGRDEIERWRLANLAGPALAAAFANSPVLEGALTGWRSTRLAIWQSVDPSRTGLDGAQIGPDGVEAYRDFAGRAEAMPIPREDGEPVPFRLAFADWLAGGNGRPDLADLEHHLTTLFPPVRPRGYLEVRYLDALPERWMAVPVSLLATLLYEPGARRTALELLSGHEQPLSDQWRRAAQHAVADPALAATACALFDIALAAMHGLPDGYLPPEVIDSVRDYRERFPASGRCPADEQLERFLTGAEDPLAWI